MKARRQFLLNASATAIGFAGLRSFSAFADKKDSQAITGYGDLQSDPEDVIDLPKGFSYKIIGKAGEKMDDGLNLPG
ncbi:MAG: DUF839 domain-containing protein, partial [Opitutae bacterium]|nr:DUF839 domain-containing protein [Opitutae bacterium]